MAATLLAAGCRKLDDPGEWIKRLKDPVQREAAVGYFVGLRQQARTAEEKARVSSLVVPVLCELYQAYSEPAVLQHIVSFGDKRAIPTLVSVLRSPTASPASTALVARTLVDLNATSAVKPLSTMVQTLSASSEVVSDAGLEAVKVLGKLDDRSAVPALIKALEASRKRSDVRLCKAAATSLAELQDVRAIPALTGALLTRSDHGGDCYPQGRVALARLGQSAIKVLLGLLKAPDGLDSLAGEGVTTDQATVRIVWLLGDVMAREAAPLLLAMATSTTRDASIREAAVAALGQAAGEAAVEPLLRLLKDRGSHHRLRVLACQALTRLGARRAIPVLLDLADSGGTLAGGNESLRYAAAEAYGLLVGAEVDAGYERIKEIWKKENKRSGKIVFRRVLDRQDMAVRHQNDPLRYAPVVADRNQTPVRRGKAVVMITTLPGGRKALPHLVRALHVRDTSLRRLFLWSAMRLGTSKDRALVKTLQAIIKRDASRDTRFAGQDLESDGRVALAVILRKGL